MAANLFDEPLLPPPDEGSQNPEPKVPAASKPPVAPPKPKVSQPNWASIKPRDVLTNDEFHQLDLETKRYILNKVSPEFAQASKADQDNELAVDRATWNDYFTNTPATEPNLIDEIWNWTKKKVGETKDLISGAFTPPTQKMRAVTPSGPGVPPTLAPPPAQEPIPLRQYIPPSEPEPQVMAPPPSQHVTLPTDQEADFQKWYTDIAAKTGRDKNPDDPRHYYDYRAAYLAGSVPDATGHMSSQFKDLDSPERYREGIDTITGKPAPAMEPSHAPVGARPSAQDLLSAHAPIPAGPSAPVQPTAETPEQRQTRYTKMAKGDPFMAARLAAQQYWGTDKLLEVHPLMAQIPRSLAKGVTLGGAGVAGPEPKTLGQKATAFVGELAGSAPYYYFGGMLVNTLMKGAESIPIVGQAIAKARQFPRIQKLLGAAEKGGAGAKATIEAGKAADPQFAQAVDYILTNPNLARTIGAVSNAIESGTALGTVATIHSLASGQDPKRALVSAYALGMAGELLRAAPVIRNLADTFKLNVKDPKLSDLLNKIGGVGTRAEIEKITTEAETAFAAMKDTRAAWAQVQEMKSRLGETSAESIQAEAQFQAMHENYIKNVLKQSLSVNGQAMAEFRDFLNDYMLQGYSSALGTALQSATAYSLAAFGQGALLTPGDIKQKLKGGAEEALTVAVAIGMFNLPSVMKALSMRAGKILSPGDAAIEWASMKPNERANVVDNIPPEDTPQLIQKILPPSEAPPAPEQYKPIPTDIRTQPLAPPPAEEPVAPVKPPSIPPEAPTGLQGGAPEIPIPGAPPTAAPPPLPAVEQTSLERHRAWQAEQDRRDKEIADREAEAQKAKALTPEEKAAILAPPHGMEGLPEGVSYNGVQTDEDGKVAFDLYTDAKTGSTFSVKPGELITDKLEQSRAKFAAAPPTLETPLETPPGPAPVQLFSYAADLPNVELLPAMRKMAETILQHAIKLDIAEPIIEGLLEGKSVPRLAEEIKKTLGNKSVLTVTQLKNRIVQIRDLKGIPERSAYGNASLEKFAENARNLKRAAAGEILTPPPATPELAPVPSGTVPTTGKSWAGEFLISGKWSGNRIRFRTKEEAESATFARFSNWTMPEEYRVVESDDEVNYQFDKATGDVRPVDTAVPKELPPPPEEIVPEVPKIRVVLGTVGQKETGEDLIRRNRDKFKTAKVETVGRDTFLHVSQDEALELARFFSDASQYLSRNGQMRKGIQAWEVANEIASEAGFSQSDIAPMGGKVSIEPAPLAVPPVVQWTKGKIIPTRAGYKTEPIPLEAPPATFEAEHPLSDLSGGPLLPPEPEAVAQSKSEQAKAARNLLRRKIGARSQERPEMAIEGAEPPGPTREELLGDPEVFDAMTSLGEDYYNGGVTDKATWHATLYRDMEDIAEGLGEDLEPLFPGTWEAITGNRDYIGGTGGIYGSRYGDVEDLRGGRGGARDNLAPAEGGGKTVWGGKPAERPEPRPTDELSTEPGVEGATGAGNLESAQREARYTFRGKPPVILTRGQRRVINEQVQQLVATKQPGDPLSDEEKNILRQYTGSGGLSESDKERGVLYEHYTSYRMGDFLWDKLRAMGFPMDNLTIMDPAHGIGNTSSGFAPPDSKLFATEIDPVAYKVSRLLFPDLKISELPFEEFPPRRDIDVFSSNVPFNAARGALRYSDEAKEYKDIRALHDFFFVKAVDMTRPNGVVMFITSTGTMDKADDTARKRINQRAEFLGAYRTPGGEFSKNTQYEGSTDIIFLRKRTPEEIESWTDSMYQDEFIHALDAEESGLGAKISSYYMKHPEKVWGTLDAGFGSRYETQMGVRPFQKEGPDAKKVPDQDRYLQAIADALNDDIRYTPKETQAIKIETEEALDREILGDRPPGMKVGTVVWDEEKQKFGYANKEGFILQATELPLTGNSHERVRRGLRLIELGDELFNALRDNKFAEADRLRAILRPLLTGYKKVYATAKDNPSGDPSKDKTLWRYLGGGPQASPFPFADPRIWRLAALTDRDGNPGPIFTTNSIYVPPLELRAFNNQDLVDTAKFVYETTGEMNWSEVASRYQGTLWKGPEDLVGHPDFSIAALDADGKPVMEINDEYMYGSLWPKIDQTAQMAEEIQSRLAQLRDEAGAPEAQARAAQLVLILTDQLARLRLVLPEQADAAEIIRRSDPFSAYLEDRIVKAWLFDLIPDLQGAEKLWDAERGKMVWHLAGEYARGHTELIVKIQSTEKYQDELGLEHSRPIEKDFKLVWDDLQHYMRRFRMRKEVPTGETDQRGEPITKIIVDEEGEKAYAELSEMFRIWSLGRPSLFENVVPKYNRAYRTFRERFYSDKQLDIKGLSTIFKGQALEIQPHQWQGVGRAVHTGSGIIAYAVGGGKTLTAIMLVAHLKQRNKVRKPILVVPAKVVKNWAYEINQALPDATILDLSGMKAANRYKMLQRAAVTDADYILMTFEGMKEIPLRKSEEYIQEDIRKLEDRLRAIKAHEGDKRTENQIQQQILKYEEKLKKLQDMKKTKTIWFEDLGSDAIIVDEIHNHKNTPKDYGDMTDYVRGGKYSQRAADMQYKTRYIHERKGGRKGQNVWGLTATPTPNHPSEIYAMLGYVAPEEWTSRGIENAGDFMSQFGRIEAREVQTPTGVPKTKTIWAGYKNLTELRTIFRRYVDYRTIETMKIPRPEGIYQDHTLDPIDAVTECAGYVAWLQEFVQDHFQQAAAQGINHLSVLTIARKLAADPAIFDARKYGASVGAPGSKLETVVNNMISLDTGENTQLVFCDLYRGGYMSKDVDDDDGKIVEGDDSDALADEQDSEHFVEVVNIHKYIKQKLMDSGVPEDQIAIVNGQINNGAVAKFRVQQENAEGKIRFLIGSTQSMGEGMNLQTSTTDIHHFDVPYNPAGLEQRDGRGLRQGNRNESVTSHRYLVRGTSDAKMYDILAAKDKWNKELWMGEADEVLDFDEDGHNFRQLADNASIPQETLDYYRARHAVQSVDEEMKALLVVEERVRHHLKVVEDDIKQRQERIKEIEDDIAKGYASDWDRRRMQSHQEHVAQLMNEHPDYHPEYGDKRKEIAERRNVLNEARVNATLYVSIYEEAKAAGRAVEELEREHQGELSYLGEKGRAFIASSYIPPNIGKKRKKKDTHAQAVADANAEAGITVADMPAFEEGHPDPQIISGPPGDPLYTPLSEPPEMAEFKRKEREMPTWPREEELGPAYLFTTTATRAEKQEMTSGVVPSSIVDDLKTNSEIELSATATIKPGTAGWIISDGTRRFRVIPYDINSIDVFEVEAWGRIQAPELMNLADDLIQIATQHGVKEAIKLSTRLRTSYGRFWGERMKEHIQLRPELFKPENREALARVLAHEIGHLIDWLPTRTTKRGNLIGRLLSLRTFLRKTMAGVVANNKDLRKELIALSEYWHPYDLTKARPGYIQLRRQSVELYADFISVLLNSPGTARKYAPKFYREFHANLDTKPDVKTEYFKLRMMMQGTSEEHLDDRLRRTAEMFLSAENVSAAVELESHEDHRTTWQGLKDAVFYRQWEIEAKVNEVVKDNPTAVADVENPKLLYDELSFKIANDQWLFADEVERTVMKGIIEKAGITAQDIGVDLWQGHPDFPKLENYGAHIVLGIYMYLHRASTERAHVANPKVVGGEFAADTLERLRDRIGPEKFQALEDAAHAYIDIHWKFVEQAFDAGIYPERAREYFEEHKYDYVKFVGEKYIKEYVSPKIRAQIGYAGAIENPFLSDFKMRLSLIKLLAAQGARKSVVSFWQENFPGEIFPAKPMVATDVIPRWDTPKDADGKELQGYDVIEIMENGKTKGYYVDKYIADAVNHPSAEKLATLASWLNSFYKFWWKLIILYNLSFGGWSNIARDMLTNYKKLPLNNTLGPGDFFQLLGAYRRAVPHVYRHMKDHGDPLVREMIQNYEISAPTMDAPETELEEDAYRLILKRAGIYKKNGELDRTKLQALHAMAMGVLKPLALISEFGESLGKVAGHIIRVEAGERGKGLALNIRRNTGTPAWYRKGKYSRTLDRIFPFTTMFVQGWNSEYTVATEPATRGGYFLRMMKLLMLLTMARLAFDYFADKIFGKEWGAKIRRAYQGITGYKKHNYLNLLVGYDKENKPIVFQMPLDEGTRTVWSVMEEMLDGYMKDDPETIENIGNAVWGQLPTPNPAINIVSSWGMYYGANINPTDRFRNTTVIPQDMYDARDKIGAAGKLFLYTLNQAGLGNFQTYDTSSKNWYQIWTQMDPVVGRWAGRIISYGSGYGWTEEERRLQRKQIMGQAQSRLEKKGAGGNVGEFYIINSGVLRDKQVRDYQMRNGMSYAEASQRYPEAFFAPQFAAYARAITAYQKQIDAAKNNSKYTRAQVDAFIKAKNAQMDAIAKKALQQYEAAKGKRLQSPPSGELPSRLPEPPTE